MKFLFTSTLFGLAFVTSIALSNAEQLNDERVDPTISILPVTETQFVTVTESAVVHPPKTALPTGFVKVPRGTPSVSGEASTNVSVKPVNKIRPASASARPQLSNVTSPSSVTTVAKGIPETSPTLAPRQDSDDERDNNDNDDNDNGDDKKLGDDFWDPENKKGHHGPTFDNSGPPFCFLKEPDRDAGCPDGSTPEFSWRCLVLNLPHMEQKKDDRSWRWYKCPGLVEGW